MSWQWSAAAAMHSSPSLAVLAPLAGSVDPTSALTTYGPLGICFVLVVVGLLVPKYAYDRLIKENERLSALAEQAAPLIAKNSEVTAEAIALIHLLQAQAQARPPGTGWGGER